MNAPKLNDNLISMPREEFEQLLERVAERGALAALHDVGLDGENAAHDIRKLRNLLDAYNTAKHIAWQTVVKIVTTGFLTLLAAGALLKLKVFGGS